MERKRTFSTVPKLTEFRLVLILGITGRNYVTHILFGASTQRNSFVIGLVQRIELKNKSKNCLLSIKAGTAEPWSTSRAGSHSHSSKTSSEQGHPPSTSGQARVSIRIIFAFIFYHNS